MDRNASSGVDFAEDWVALRKESVDRNCHSLNLPSSPIESLSARRAWIEIMLSLLCPVAVGVALRKESVDRNAKKTPPHRTKMVALRKESVDRNFYYSDKDVDWVRVALRKESVDRNQVGPLSVNLVFVSLSARRAWIEMANPKNRKRRSKKSLSARRAWIEMFLSMGLDGRFKVALRKESVDRNRSTHKTSWQSCASLSARRAWIEMKE